MGVGKEVKRGIRVGTWVGDAGSAVGMAVSVGDCVPSAPGVADVIVEVTRGVCPEVGAVGVEVGRIWVTPSIGELSICVIRR